MLSSLSVSNFKSLKEIDNISIAPITVLCGTNSCGKSSLIESVLLLKQTMRDRELRESLILNGEYVRLGDYENVVFAHDTERKMNFSYTFTFRSMGIIRQMAPLLYFYRGNFRKIERVSVRLSYIVGTYKSDRTNKQYIDSVKIEVFDNEMYKKSFLQFRREEGGYIINCDLTQDKKEEARIIIENQDCVFLRGLEFNGVLPSMISLNNSLLRIVGENREKGKVLREVMWTITDFFQVISKFIDKACNEMSYIGPLREAPARRYIYDEVVSDIGTRGENAAYLLLNEQNELSFKEYVLPDTDDNTFSFEQAVNEWMDYLGVKGLEVKRDKEILRVFVNDTNTGNTVVNIADVGFGISQVFPIVLEGLRMEQDSLLILEQPEIHLHPKLQMQIADFIIAAASAKKNFLIETHSDHFINRLVRRIVEDETGQLASLVNIYFVTPSPEGATFSLIEIDECQGIVNWPDGFFDQSANELELIIKAGLKKRKDRRRKKLESEAK